MKPTVGNSFPWRRISKYGLLIVIILLLGAFFSLLGQLSKTIDIANEEQNGIVLGADNNDFSNPFLDGFDSLAMGDINGDEIADLIIGAPSADGPENWRTHAGEVYVIFGPPPASLDLARTKPDITIIGADEGDNLGTALASGDVDGDGFDDIFIGAPSADSLRNERKDAGEVYIVFGSSGPPDTIDLAETEADATVLGADTGDNLGLAITDGDINGDGLDDIIIGAPAGSGPGNGRGGAGEAYVIFGGFSFTSIDLAATRADLTIFGDDVGDHLGLALATGDINTDGIGDLIVGASAGDGPGNSRDNAGDVYAILGSPNPPSSLDLAEKSADLTILGAGIGDRLGIALASGDTNGDGADDIAIGAFAGDGPGDGRANAGEVYLLFGGHDLPPLIDLALTGADVTIFGPDTGDNLGVSVTLGDVDQDGKDDIFVGAPGGDGPRNERRNAGEAYLIFGSAIPPAKIDLADTTVDFSTILGADPGDNLGVSVISSDVDGDGLVDLAVEAVNADGPGDRKVNSGELYVILGSTFATPNTPPVADAGTDQAVTVGATVQLDGSGSSDPDGDPLTFNWQFISRPDGSVAALSNARIARPTFVADKLGDYVLNLSVNDGRGGSDTAQVTITAVEGGLKGDVDLDGDVDILDAKLAAEYIVGLEDLNEEQRWAADVRPPCRPPDEHIDVTDVRWIAEFSIGLQDEMFCYGGSASSIGSVGVNLGVRPQFGQTQRSAPTGRAKILVERKRLALGETASVRLTAKGLPKGLGGLQVGPKAALTFNPQLIQVKDIRGLGPYRVLAHRIDNAQGEARFVLISLGHSVKSGAIIELEVSTVGIGEGQVDLTGLRLLNARGQAVNAAVVPGRVQVIAKTPLRVTVSPSLATHGAVRFQAEGEGIQGLQVAIYDLAGRAVFTSGLVFGNTFAWNLQGIQGTVANGIYLYVVIANRYDGTTESRLGKLAILR